MIKDAVIWSKRTSQPVFNAIFDRLVYVGNPSGIDTVADMKAKKPAVGDTLTTLGYYEKGDGGGAIYVVEESASADTLTVFELANGTFARLLIMDSMNVLQFGAVNVTDINSYSGNDDSTESLKAAFNCGAFMLNFPSGGGFLVTEGIVITANNLTINGNNSSLFTNQNYPSTVNKYLEHIKIDGCINVVWDRLNIIELQSHVITSVVTQLQLLRSQGIKIKNSIFRGPGPKLVRGEDNQPLFSNAGYSAMTYQDNERFNHNNIDLYTGWHDVTISGCELYLSHDGPAGLSVMARDISGLGASGLVMENNYVEKVCHDEILAIGMPNAILSDIVVKNNTFVMYDGKASSSITGVLIGQESTAEPTDNVLLEGNHFSLQTTRYSVRVDKLASSSSLVMKDNTFNVKKGIGYDGDSSLLSFLGTATAQELVLNEHNTINIDNSNSAMMVNNCFFGKFDVANQTVNVSGEMPSSIGEELHSFCNNTVVVEGQVAAITRDVDVVTGNHVEANYIKFAFERYDKPIIGNIDYSGNTFKSRVSTTVYLIYAHATVAVDANAKINANNNRYIVDNMQKANCLIAVRGSVPTPAFILVTALGCTAELFDGTPIDFDNSFSLLAGVTEDYIERG